MNVRSALCGVSLYMRYAGMRLIISIYHGMCIGYSFRLKYAFCFSACKCKVEVFGSLFTAVHMNATTHTTDRNEELLSI